MASSISDWLFGSTTNPKANSTSVVSQGQPEWWLETVKNLIGKSSAIAAEPYQAYTGQRIAGPAADTTASFDLTRQGIGGWKPNFNTAATTLSNISTGNADNVMDMIARRGQQNLTENLLPAVQDTFIGSGQFGGGRMNEFSGRALRDTNQSILDAQAGAYLQNQGQQAAAAQGLGALSAQGQTQDIKDAASLQSIGAAQEGLEQRSLDTAYQQFQEERNAPRDTAQFMSQMIRGYNPPTTTTTSTSAPATTGQMGASPLAQLAGAGTAAYGLSQAFKRGGPVDMRVGGPVPKGIGKYADGGKVDDSPTMRYMRRTAASKMEYDPDRYDGGMRVKMTAEERRNFDALRRNANDDTAGISGDRKFRDRIGKMRDESVMEYADGGAVSKPASGKKKSDPDAAAKERAERARLMRMPRGLRPAMPSEDDVDRKMRNSDRMNGGEEDVPGYAKGGWIQKAVKKPGALHRDLGVPKGEKIPVAKINAAAKEPGKIGQRARFVQTMRGIGRAA